jgi:signal transduction histidine kinase
MLWLAGALGLLGIVVTVIFGIRVREAIAPRIGRLVTKVRRFQETGVHDHDIGEREDDELGVLDRALDAGFSAIEARDRERDRFLAVAAHELKTPISNIQTFARAALDYPVGSDVRNRALEVIGRQAQRIGRLVEDLFLVARARSFDLPFAPAPMTLAAPVQRIAAEIQSMNPPRRFDLEIEEPASLFADEALLTAGLWTMLSYALARAHSETPVEVRVSRTKANALVTVSNFGEPFTEEELNTVFEPLVDMRYEGTDEARIGLGLYLSAQIARTHGGTMSAFNDGHRPVLVLSLPC